jgi:ubiquinone/menaquinone biosynthesis C-methylase UbiE
MGEEVNLMRLYPQSKGRLAERPEITDDDRRVSREFGFDYFDGDRRYGYGGFSYHPRFWSDTVRLISDHYGLSEQSSILDIGCAKGFMLADFREYLPNAKLRGLDISAYAIDQGNSTVRSDIYVGDAISLPFDDDEFDLVLSINTLHNLDRSGVIAALGEIDRVSRGAAFIMVDGWKTEDEKLDMKSWVLTAQTMLHASEWLLLFGEANFKGDYFFWTVS